MGCFRVPGNCSGSGCIYSLTWQKDGSDQIRFEYAARFETTNPLPWVGFGIAENPKMVSDIRLEPVPAVMHEEDN